MTLSGAADYNCEYFAIKQLPNLHRDPFDRIMLAQAKAAGLTFVTADPAVLQYPGTFLRAM